MSAHRDFCRPPTRIDLSACLEFLVSAVNLKDCRFHSSTGPLAAEFGLERVLRWDSPSGCGSR